MATYRTVNLSFWTDSKVDDDFSPEDKYFYLYLLTNPHTSICGCYEVSMKQMCRETGYNEDTVHRLLSRLEKQHGVIRFSETTKEVLILNWAKYNWTRSDKMLSAAESAANHIKNHSFRNYLAQQLNNFGYESDTLSIPYGYPMDTSDTDTVTDTVYVSDTVNNNSDNRDIYSGGRQEKPQKQKRDRRSIPPTIEEVAEYCKKNNYGIDPNYFVDFYTSKNWMVGKTKMTDWQASVRTWVVNEKKRKANGQGKSGKRFSADYTVDDDTEGYI